MSASNVSTCATPSRDSVYGCTFIINNTLVSEWKDALTSSSSTGCYANGLSLTGSCARVITISPLICENITRTVNLCCTPRSRGVSICALKVFHTFIFKGKYTILPRSCRTTVWNSLVNKSTQSNCIIARGTRAESLISFLMLYYHFFLNLFFYVLHSD